MNLETLQKKYSDLPPTWFEFLFDHSRVVKHLTLLDSTPAVAVQPSACQMITSFMEKISDEDCKALYATRLRTLSLYVGGWLKWRLSDIVSAVPFVSQVGLLEALKNKTMIDIDGAVSLERIPPACAMSHVIFSRWIVRCVIMHMSGPSKISEVCIANSEQMAGILSPLLPYAVHILQTLIESSSCLNIPWTLPVLELANVMSVGGDNVSSKSIECQVCFDLGQLLFQQGKFPAACSLLQRVKSLYGEIADDDLFCTIDHKVLEADLIACLQVSEFPASALAASSSSETAKLVTRMEQCRKHCMQGVDFVLLEGNASLSIPMPYRRDIEETLAAVAYPGPRSYGQPSSMAAIAADPTVAEATELHWRVTACNAVHNVVLGMPVSPSFWLTWYQVESNQHLIILLDVCWKFSSGNASHQSITALLDFAKSVCYSSSHGDKYMKILDRHELTTRDDHGGMYMDDTSGGPSDTREATADGEADGGGPGAVQYPWNDRHCVHNLECQLFSSSNVDDVQSLVRDLQQNLPVGLAGSSLAEWWSKDRHNNTVLSVLLIKAHHLQQSKAFDAAEHILRTAWHLAESIRTNAIKNDVLRRLSDSQLSLDIQQYLTIQRNDHQRFTRLVRGTKDFMSKAVTTISVLSNPLLECCTVFLINNSKEWPHATDILNRVELTRTSKTVQLCHALMATALSISLSGQDPRKHARQLFDLVAELLMHPTQYKRSTEGLKKEAIQRSKEAEQRRMLIIDFAQRITDPTALSVLVSCLVRIHTALVLSESGDGGDSKTAASRVPDISCQHPLIWPVAVNNPSNMSRSDVILIVQQVLEHCLHQHGNHSGFMCTMADVMLVSQHYTSALRMYLSLGSAHSNFFSSPVPADIWTDQVYHSMISCCQSINAHTQALVLCQLLTPVDYQLANHCVQQANCHDAMEYYYDCLWDMAILEYVVHNHSLKGEDEKRQCAVNAIADPDLNTANSGETCRRAAQMRLNKFLHRMAAIYI